MISGEGKSWRIEIARTPEKQILKLDLSSQRSIQRFLRERLVTGGDPCQWGRALQSDKRGLWCYRVGDHRLICDIQDERITVLVLEVGNRKDVYR